MAKEKNKKQKLKNTKVKASSIRTEEQEQIIRFCVILGIIVLFIVAIYFFTKIVVNKETKKETDVTAVEIDYNKVIIGNMLNQASEEYYVFAYKGNDNKALYYSTLIDKYMTVEDSIKVYWADLDNKLNEKYIAKDDSEIDSTVKSLDNLKLGDFALIKIKEGKIKKIIVTPEDAKKELGI